MALWNSSEQDQPLLTPLPTSLPLKHRRRRICRSTTGLALVFITTAMLSGALVALFLTVSEESRPDSFLFKLPLPFQDGPRPPYPPPAEVAVPSLDESESASPPHYEADLEELRSMIDRTKGFYVRDYSLGLGWNNVCRRVMFQHTNLIAHRFVISSRPAYYRLIFSIEPSSFLLLSMLARVNTKCKLRLLIMNMRSYSSTVKSAQTMLPWSTRMMP